MKKNLCFLIVCVFFQSCSCQNIDFNKIIDKYDSLDFSQLRNMSIYRGISTQNMITRLCVNIYHGSCSPYLVKLNEKNGNIIEINNDLVLDYCGKDYLSREKIESVVKKYLELDLYLVQVDNDGNVYIKPYQGRRRLVFLRKLPDSTPKDLNLFKHYKGNWYIRE